MSDDNKVTPRKMNGVNTVANRCFAHVVESHIYKSKNGMEFDDKRKAAQENLADEWVDMMFKNNMLLDILDCSENPADELCKVRRLHVWLLMYRADVESLYEVTDRIDSGI